MNIRIYRLFFGGIFLFFFTIIIPYTLTAATLRVPDDYGSIHLAVEASQDGDIIEVAPGYYFETDIILDKDICLRSEVPYAAVLDGGGDRLKNLLVVRAKVEIEGFVLRNTGNAIIQRDSPDVAWTAHDLAIFDCQVAGISINDREKTIGSAYLYNLIIISCSSGVSTNEAARLIVSHCFIGDCEAALSGSNHIQFAADNILLWNNQDYIKEAFIPSLPEANSTIDTGKDIFDLESIVKEDKYLIADLLLNFRKDNTNDSMNSNDGAGMLLNTIGDIYAEMDDGEQAAFWYNRALKTARQLEIQGIVIDALYNLAKLEAKNGNPQNALDYYRQTIAELEAERKDVLLLDERAQFLESRMHVYEDMLHFLHYLYQSRKDPFLAEEAFNVSEKSKARSFFDLLHQSRLLTAPNIPERMRRQRNHLIREISRIQDQLNSHSLAEKVKRRLFQMLQSREKQYRAVLLNMRKRLVSDETLLPVPHDLGYIQRNLPPETAVLEYFFGEKHAFAFMVTPDSLRFIQLPESRQVNTWIENYNLFLTMPETRMFKAAAGSERLFQILIGQFTESAFQNIHNLVIVPCGHLNRLPFETLVCPWIKDQRPAYLLRRFHISYAGSASVFTDINRMSGFTGNQRRLLAVANHAPRKVVEKYPEAGYYRMTELPPLRYCEREIGTIRAAVGEGNIKSLIGQAAGENRFKALDLSQFKIMHFATHGVIYNQNWWRSALLLYPPKRGREDGLLQPTDVFGLSLNADLVVLSACRTGQGKLFQGEGILGFIQAFHSAGARCVVSSLWGINDKSTVEFMRYFYESLTDGQSIAHALAHAKEKMLDTRFSHPYYWAAFIAHGASLYPVFD
jgi:CHAT domain-containing protein